MSERILLSSPDVGEAEEAALLRAFRTGWIAPLGPEVDSFEAELADFNDRQHCVALSSGTAALHLALLNLGVGRGDVVLTASMTFAATANAIAYTGATPVFVDSSPDGCIGPELLAEAAGDQARQGARIGAIVPVDLLGKVADQERIAEVAARHDVPVLSDAAESLGATRHGRPSGAFGVAAAISFNGNKIMTTSGGGALLTDDAEFANRARYLATQARQPVLHYEHTDIGFNYRLSNLLAGMGRAQLQRLPQMIERRRALRTAYANYFASVAGVEIFGQADGRDGDDTADNCWLTSVLVDPARTGGWDRDDLIGALAAANIEARPLWKPMHAQPVHASSPAYIDGTSDRLFATGISLPSSSALTDAQQDRVLATIDEFIGSRS